MKRIWSVQEQVYVDPTTKLRFEFTSVHTECIARGEEPPAHDRMISLNLFNESGNRVIRMTFDRNGMCQGAVVEPHETAVPQTEDERILHMLTPAVTPPAAEWKGINLAEQFSGDI